jgi:hypothetical protein
METIVSKKQKAMAGQFLRKADTTAYPMRNLTLEDVLKEPFTREKHEKAKATLEKYPVPDWILEWKKSQLIKAKNH